MAYTRAWSDTTPPGSQAASTIDDEIRNLRVDIKERMNDIIRDWTTDPITSKFGCSLFTTLQQLTTSGVPLAINFDSEFFDNGALHDTVTNKSRITIPTGGNKGVWLFLGLILYPENSLGSRKASILKNGATTVSGLSTMPGDVTRFVSVDTNALVAAPAVGDYFELIALQDSGTGFNTRTPSTFLAVHLL